ncbi:NAD(P)-binding protein [Auricularia subglabra TFB-10046 SS5]|nr:NAD(P)-binding protein [Auricularia subglabra TFB-10046 SS5]
MSSPSTFLVTGATGAQGGAVTRELLKAGHRVHALVRNPDSPKAKDLEARGVVLFAGDYENAEAIMKAAVGVKGMFLNLVPAFPDPDSERNQAQRFVDAARAAGTVESIVHSTGLNADKHKQWVAELPGAEYGFPMRLYFQSMAAAEDVIRTSGIKNWTIVRPPWLDYNYLLPHCVSRFPKLHTERKLTTALHADLPLAHLDADDLGVWAAAALLDPPKFAGKELDLAAENLTLVEVVRALEKFAGVEIATEFIEPAELAKDTSSQLKPIMAAVADWQNTKGLSVSPEAIAELRTYGLPLKSFTEFLEKNKVVVFETLKVQS